MFINSRLARLLAVAISTLLILAACAAPGETPGVADTPGQTPAGTPGESPADTPGETPAGTPGETPAGTPGETPAGTPGESPAGTPGETPAGTPTAGESPPSGATGDLFAFGVNYQEGADEIARERIDLFLELNPDLNVTFSEAGFDEAQFLTALQTDQPPDVVRMDTSLIATYVARGVLQPLDDCISQHGVDMGKYYDAPVNQATINGQVYGIPEFMTTMNWLLNESAFTDAGLDPAAFDFSNWDAIRQANEQTLQANGGITALGIDPKIPEFFPLWVHANGGQLLSDDGMTAQLDSPEAVEALQFTVDLINAHGGPNEFLDFRQTWDFFGGSNQFAADQVAAHPMEQWYLNVLIRNSRDADVMAQPFVDRQGNGLTMAVGGSFVIPTASRNPEAACLFAITLTHEAAWLRAAQERARLQGAANTTGVFTANQIANDRIFTEVVDLEDLPERWRNAVRVYLDNWENAFALPPSPANARIFAGNDSIIGQAIARAMQGEDPQQVLTEANQEAQQAIEEAAGP